jgi:hypothetical protein
MQNKPEYNETTNNALHLAASRATWHSKLRHLALAAGERRR